MPEHPPTPSPAPSRRIVLLNDTSSIYHFGCTGTSTAIHHAVRSLGHTLTSVPHGAIDPTSAPSRYSEFDSPAFFQSFWNANAAVFDHINAADVVLINGEGTLHGLMPIPLALLYAAHAAKTRLRKNVQVINHSCYPQDDGSLTDPAPYSLYLKVYRGLDFVAVRESVSHSLLTTLGVHARRSFDCLPLYVEANLEQIEADRPDPDNGELSVLFAASAMAHPSVSGAMASLARHLASRGVGCRVLSGALSSPSRLERELFAQIERLAPGTCSVVEVSAGAQWLREIRSASLLVSGRFHHSVAAASLGTPFVLLPSNTPKIDALTELGCEPPLDTESPSLARLLIERCEAALDAREAARVGAPKLRARLRRMALRNFEGLGQPVDPEPDSHAAVPRDRAASMAEFLGHIAAFEREAAAHDAPFPREPSSGATPVPGPSPDRIAQLAERIIRVWGVGRVSLVGRDAEGVQSALRRRGVDARIGDAREVGPDVAPAVRVSQTAGQTVVVLNDFDSLDEPSLSAAISRLRARASGDAIVTVSRTAERDRAWWEGRFFLAGFRKHPLTQHLFPFESLEHDEDELTLLLQRVPDAALAAYPLESLKAERTLHMDMLRESGRRSDAHIARYTLACRYLRPGDTVLDCACGLGYGAAVLAAGASPVRVIGIDNSAFAIQYARANFPGPLTEFRAGEAGDLTAIPDASIDAVVTMETLEHLPDPEAFLSECRRILTPAGRIILSVPNDWTDESGRDPNPHHLHVYTWNRVREQIERGFYIETAFAQVAGGGMKLTDRPRQLTRVDAVRGPRGGTQAEWHLIVGMKSPFPAGTDAAAPGALPAYRETVFPHAAARPDCNLVAYARDYDNPWLVRALVSIGLRATEPALLGTLAQRALELARPGSSDEGAAICVLSYLLLAHPSLDPGTADTLLARINAFDAAADTTPHAQRWRISNRYVGALLLAALGRREEARREFLSCAAIDPACFSPLLATKTVDALFQAGRLSAADGDIDAARSAWRAALDAARRALAGDWVNILGEPDYPVSFGMPEAAQVLDLAARCAAGLAQIPDLGRRPGQAWSVIQNASASEQLRWVKALESSNAWLDQHRRTWIARARSLEDSVASHSRGTEELRAWIEDLEQSKAWLASQNENYQLLAQRQESSIDELKAEIASQQAGRAWLQQHAANWEAQARKQEGMIADLKKSIDDDKVAKEWLENSRAAWEQTANDRERLIQQLRDWIHQLEGAKP